jgi:hypothetical protein
MVPRQLLINVVLSLAASAVSVSPARAQAAEVFTGTAAVTTAAAATASAEFTIAVDRKMPQAEADALVGAFKAGGASALRKALVGVPPTGSVRFGTGTATPTRLTLERATDRGRLLTIVADQPILFLGAGAPGAKVKDGYDFTVIDLEVGADGSGSGTLAPAAKVTVRNGAFVVEDYASDLIRLTAVKKVK